MDYIVTPLPIGVQSSPLFIESDNFIFDGVESNLKKHKIEVNFINKIRTSEENGGKCVLFLHGGGYFALTHKFYQFTTGTFCKILDCPVYCPNYRKAPENPFPAGLVDAISCYLYLLKIYKKVFIIGGVFILLKTLLEVEWLWVF